MKTTIPRFTDDEIQEILEALFQEKKKVKELQLKLLKFHQDSEIFRDSSQQMNEKLQSQIKKERTLNQSLKNDIKENSLYIGQLQLELLEVKKTTKQNDEEQSLMTLQHKEAFNELTSSFEKKEGEIFEQLKNLQIALENEKKAHHEESERIKVQLSDSVLHAEQLEKGIGYLRAKLEESKIDKELLSEELYEIQTMFREASQEITLIRGEFQEKKQEKDSAEEEMRAIQCQFDQLKKQISVLKLQNEEQIQKLNCEEKNSILLQNKQSYLNQELIDKSSEISSLNNALKEAQLSINEIKKDAEKDSETIFEQSKQIKKLEEDLKQQLILRGQFDELSAKFQLVESEKNTFKKQCEQLQKQVQELSLESKSAKDNENKLRNLINSLNEKDSLIETKNTQLAILNQEKSKCQESLNSIQSLIEEKDSQLKIAQQHFGKKVKEAATLQEKLDEQKAIFLEQHHQLQASQSKIVELKALLEDRQKQERRVEEMLNESVKSSSRWEEKYLQLASHVQELELRNKEMKKFEEKFHLMQQVLSGLNQPFESQVPSFVSESSKSSISFEEEKLDQSYPKPKEGYDITKSSDLFSVSQHQKLKQTFFDA